MRRAEPFRVKDCTLITMSVNLPPVYDLRDLLERLEVCPAESLYHHFCQTLLRPTFDDPEYHNDLAFWAKHHLHDKTMAEKLAIVNPFDFADLEGLRLAVLDIVEDRIGELPHISNVQTGGEFRFLQALNVTFGTASVVRKPEEVPEALGAMTPSSIWYHYIEARRRNPNGLDDFSLWLQAHEISDPHLLQALSEVDFYFFSLRRLQEELVSITATHLSGEEL